jgi:hypothetical protein
MPTGAQSACRRETLEMKVGNSQRFRFEQLERELLREQHVALDQTWGAKAPMSKRPAYTVELLDVDRRFAIDAIAVAGGTTDNFEAAVYLELVPLVTCEIRAQQCSASLTRVVPLLPAHKQSAQEAAHDLAALQLRDKKRLLHGRIELFQEDARRVLFA